MLSFNIPYMAYFLQTRYAAHIENRFSCFTDAAMFFTIWLK